ncbi:MAG TPA: glycosyltransferase [Gammaproteobacteria bacterium]|nr:glycosyltransferase [Gammaproteobacteria bacterium]
MTPTLPLVSLIIMTHNHEKCIDTAIQCALAQDYTNTEIIISDDASTDRTVEIIQKYLNQYPHKIKLLTATQNRGVTENWFKAVAHCNGKYITTVSGDDSIPSQKISKQITLMESDPDIAICYTDASVFDVAAQKERYRLSDKAPTKSGSIKTALADSLYYSPTLMFQKKFAPKINLFSDVKHASDLAYYKEVMILSAPKGKIAYLPEVLYIYNKHAANLTVVRNNANYQEHIKAIKILQEKYPEYRSDLNPAIYDFSCVGFFKNMAHCQFKEANYFLQEGLKASHYNPFKFLRALWWAVKFLYQKQRKTKP